MASNQAEIGHLSELANREPESIGISDRLKEISLKAGLATVLILAMAFIALPVVALFLKSPLDTTLRSLHDPMVLDALWLSLATSTLTTIIVVVMGTPIAYVSARFHYFGKEMADSLIDLPVIMPPAVAGIALLVAFGSFQYVQKMYDVGILMQDLPVQSWIPRAILPIGFLLLAFRFSQVLWRLATGQDANLLGDEAKEALKLRQDEPDGEVQK